MELSPLEICRHVRKSFGFLGVGADLEDTLVIALVVSVLVSLVLLCFYK